MTGSDSADDSANNLKLYVATLEEPSPTCAQEIACDSGVTSLKYRRRPRHFLSLSATKQSKARTV